MLSPHLFPYNSHIFVPVLPAGFKQSKPASCSTWQHIKYLLTVHMSSVFSPGQTPSGPGCLRIDGVWQGRWCTLHFQSHEHLFLILNGGEINKTPVSLSTWGSLAYNKTGPHMEIQMTHLQSQTIALIVTSPLAQQVYFMPLVCVYFIKPPQLSIHN